MKIRKKKTKEMKIRKKNRIKKTRQKGNTTYHHTVQEHDGELDHLHSGQVLLPPQVGPDLGTHGGQEVVPVHDDVDEGVQESSEGCMAAFGSKRGWN